MSHLLGSFIFKVITNILPFRHAGIASKIVSENYFGFVKGRHIQDCIVPASHCVSLIYRHCSGGNIAMKIDILKAFDAMRWSFIFLVFRVFEFSSIFILRLHSIFKSARLSVLVNGSLVSYFGYSMGVH